MSTVLLYGIPIAFGVGVALIFATPVALALALAAFAFALFSLWATRDAEIGALWGMIVAVEAALFIVPLLITLAVIAGFSVDLSWLLRSPS
jgi:hypothetical protein